MHHQQPISIVQGRGLSITCDDRYLFKDIDFNLKSGEVLQVLGLNGSGKTTLLRIVAGLMAVDAGKLNLNKDIRFIYVGHRLGIKATLTPKENLEWMCALLGQQKSMTIDAALEQIGLNDVKDKLAHTLSQGQQRRIALTQLLLIEASLWILDEPLTALDSMGVAMVENLIVNHVKKGGAVILASHQPLHLKKVNLKELFLSDE